VPKTKVIFPANQKSSIEFGVIINCSAEQIAANVKIDLTLAGVVLIDKDGKPIKTRPLNIAKFATLDCSKQKQ
jgi:hypothetical protein